MLFPSIRFLLVALVLGVSSSASALEAHDFTQWKVLAVPTANGKPVAASPAPLEVTPQTVTMQAGAWSHFISPQDSTNVEVSTVATIESPATQSAFFGSSWSAWPDPKFEDQGFDAGITLRAAADGSQGYRVQWSTKYQHLALVRFPDSGYVRAVPCAVQANTPLKLRVTVAGSVIRVFVDDKQLIEYVDRLEPPLERGRMAVGVSSQARVKFADFSVRPIAAEATPAPLPHKPHFTARQWIGGRWFVFDGDEPILQLHYERDPSMFAKLRPALKPQLTFDSHWGLENQGAYKEAAVTWTAPNVTQENVTLKAVWSARHVKERFTTLSKLTVGYDSDRDTYTYDIDSELEVLPGEPFLFRYGFDFEHHTPLDPFRWQYLMIRNREGKLTYRPLSPFDPGPLEDIEAYQGLRVWHGRTGDVHRVSPAVEYQIQPEWIQVLDDKNNIARRKLHTAVCAAFYDTGVAFEPVTAKPGDKVRVKYRYTGYPAEETTQLFAAAIVQENPRIDPRHHFIFLREQWPTIRFNDALPMDKPWWGGRPLLSGHNARPTYGYVKQGDEGWLRLGPVSYGVAPVGPEQFEPGKYLVSARVKSLNTHGPGGRIEVLALKKADLHGNGFTRLDTSNIVQEQVRYFGSGTFDWRDVSFLVEVPATATGLALGLGNAGTGEVLVSQVKFERWERAAPPQTLADKPPTTPSVPDALWDLRMQEQQGLYTYNYGSSAHRTLELANLDWVSDEGRTAIRFAENPLGRADYPPLGILDQNVRHPVYGKNYAPVSHGAYAMGGHHGGGETLNGLTLAAWIKPAAEMGKSHHGGKGDILGYGARRFILGLQGQTAPYALVSRLNVNDRVESKPVIEAQRWYHVGMTCQPDAGQWRVRLYLNGEQTAEGRTTNLPSTVAVPESLILGAELFYLHDAYYRGLIGPALVIGRTLTAAEMQSLAKEPSR
jgi:hypothetical protein